MRERINNKTKYQKQLLVVPYRLNTNSNSNCFNVSAVKKMTYVSHQKFVLNTINKYFHDPHEIRSDSYFSNSIIEQFYIKKLQKPFIYLNYVSPMSKKHAIINNYLGRIFSFFSINTIQQILNLMEPIQYHAEYIDYFSSFSSTKMINSSKTSFLKNFLIADKSSVRKLRAFYLLLIGENTK